MDSISRQEIRCIYDRLGPGLALTEPFESRAKALGLALLAPAKGERILHIGVGLGREHAILRATVGADGLLAGCDLVRRMLLLTRCRAPTPLLECDAIRLPFGDRRFDRLFSAYTLDLLPIDDLPIAMAEIRRVVRPGGRVVLINLTEGVEWTSRIFIAAWKRIYRLHPQSVGGCRPQQLAPVLERTGFTVVRRVVVQAGFPSEVLVGL